MGFLHPAFLWGLIALSIPILVHLFNFRRYRTLFFSNTQFLKDLQEDTRRQSQVRKWVVLLLRMATIVALCLAFAQWIRKDNQQVHRQENAYVQLYIDNSYSMENKAEQGSLLHEAMEKAKALTDAFGDEALFMLLTQDLESRHACFLSRSEVKKEINQLQTSPQSRNLKSILQYALAQMAKQPSANKQLFLFSDFQQTGCDLTRIPSDSSVQICFVPLKGHQTNNFFIDSCWFDRPVLNVGQEAHLSVMLRNEGEEPVEKLPVRLYVGSREKAMASADIGAKGRALIEIPFTLDKEGWQDARLEITDYPITFDDQLFFSFQVTGRHRILRIHHAEGNPFLHALFAKDSSIEYQEIPIGQMDYSLLDRQDLVILDRIVDAGGGFLQNISRYVEEGGNLLLIPSTQSKQVLENRINRALQLPLFTALDTHRSRISEIQLEHALYRNTFDKVDENMQLPAIYKHYRMAQDLQDGKEVPLRLENQDEFLSQLPRGEGSVYLLSVPLDDTFGEWQRHALFVPTLYNMAVFRHKSLRLYYTIGQNEPIPFIGESLPARAVPEIRKGTFSCIPEMRSQSSHNALFAHDQINEAGNYVLVYQGDTLQHLSFNDARTESVMQYWSEKALKEQFKGDRYKEVFSQQYPTSSAWAHGLLHQPRQSTLFVWLALLFLLLEGILLRIWKI